MHREGSTPLPIMTNAEVIVDSVSTITSDRTKLLNAALRLSLKASERHASLAERCRTQHIPCLPADGRHARDSVGVQ